MILSKLMDAIEEGFTSNKEFSKIYIHDFRYNAINDEFTIQARLFRRKTTVILGENDYRHREDENGM